MLASLLLLAFQTAPVDHRPLVSGKAVSAAMLAPEFERWAVARLVGVGPAEERELSLGDARHGMATVFGVDLEVLDGWNLPSGPLRVFWSESASGVRRATLLKMVGGRVLVRLATSKDGFYLLVGGTDDEPFLTSSFASRLGEAYIAIVLPYDGDRLEPGPPKARRWATLWRAGANLSASALPDFGTYISAAPLPVTPKWRGQTRLDAKGNVLDDGLIGLSDVAWLRRLAKAHSPEFQMMVEEYLDRRQIAGSFEAKRGLVRLALERPDLFPNGLFRVADLSRIWARGCRPTSGLGSPAPRRCGRSPR